MSKKPSVETLLRRANKSNAELCKLLREEREARANREARVRDLERRLELCEAERRRLLTTVCDRLTREPTDEVRADLPALLPELPSGVSSYRWNWDEVEQKIPAIKALREVSLLDLTGAVKFMKRGSGCLREKQATALRQFVALTEVKS